ncbi:MAG: histidinol dehydrogenase, partial [Zetaproteobacteria bacterium]
GQSGIVITPDLATAVALADAFGPEHLCLSVADPSRWVDKVRNAGGIFVGEHSCEVLGDYVAGPSHIMPTGGTARFSSPLSVDDFQTRSSLLGLSPEALRRWRAPVERLAAIEGLEAHGRAMTIRTEGA